MLNIKHQASSIKHQADSIQLNLRVNLCARIALTSFGPISHIQMSGVKRKKATPVRGGPVLWPTWISLYFEYYTIGSVVSIV